MATSHSTWKRDRLSETEGLLLRSSEITAFRKVLRTNDGAVTVFRIAATSENSYGVLPNFVQVQAVWNNNFHRL